jgi:hypothetical protein
VADTPSTPGDSADDERSWTAAERALLEAALDFYAAAGGVIDLAGRERPQLRHDAAGFEAVRRAMAALEQRVTAAHAAGSSPERIAQIARIEQETTDLILQRRDAAPSPDGG